MTENDKKKVKQPQNIYIIKPGEVTNRGHGITVESEIKSIEEILNKKELHKNGN